MSKRLPQDDLDYILSATASLWDELRDQRIFITGGTGFFGNWLLETLCHANATLNLNLNVTLLTRDKSAYAYKMPHLARDPMITLLEGDVRHFQFPIQSHDYIIHAAAEANAAKNSANPQHMQDIIINGTKRVLSFSSYIQAKKMLYVSSGAVYQLESENPTKAIYAMAKLSAEQLCVEQAAKQKTAIKIARCFAFVGPHLPLEQHFAVGNFINDAMQGRAIQLTGNGTGFRSYQYAADLVIWLLTILCKGSTDRAYNVGSDEAISILDLANLVAAQFKPAPMVQVGTNTSPAEDYYIPDIADVKQRLDLPAGINLVTALQKTINWYQS